MFELITLFILMLAGHWLADYPLQGDFLAKAKQSGPLRVYHLIAHAGIHAGAVLLITSSVVLALIEWVAHTMIDELKVRNKITFAQDQALHIAFKVLYVLILALAGLFTNTN